MTLPGGCGPAGSDDAALAFAAGQGDARAFEKLVEKYQSRIYRFAFGMVKDRDEAWDIAQETFLRAHVALPGFRGRSAFSTWLYRIAANLPLDGRRRRQREEALRNAGDAAVPSGEPLRRGAEFRHRRDQRRLPRGGLVRELVAARAPDVDHVAELRVGDVGDEQAVGVGIVDAEDLDLAVAVIEHLAIGDLLDGRLARGLLQRVAVDLVARREHLLEIGFVALADENRGALCDEGARAARVVHVVMAQHEQRHRLGRICGLEQIKVP